MPSPAWAIRKRRRTTRARCISRLCCKRWPPRAEQEKDARLQLERAGTAQMQGRQGDKSHDSSSSLALTQISARRCANGAAKINMTRH